MRLVIAGICAAFATFMAPALARSLLYVADQAGDSVLPLDTATQSYRAPIVVGAHPLHPVASPDGSRVYVQSGDDASIAVIDTASASVVARIPIAAPPSTPPVSAALLSISPDSKRLYVVENVTQQITIIDTQSNSVLAAVLGPAGMGDPGQARVSPDGKRLLVSYQGERTIAAIDTGTGALQALDYQGIVADLLRAPKARTISTRADRGTTSYAASTESAAAVASKPAARSSSSIPSAPTAITRLISGRCARR